MDQDVLRAAAQALCRSRPGTALTGAGISVESGIPDFRSRGGLWTRFPPEEYATLQAFRRDPEKVWSMLAEMAEVIDRARPNPAHTALSRLERLGVLCGVVTQNIDGLHQEAGSRTVVEFHGNCRRLGCPACGWRCRRDDVRGKPVPPRCACGTILKPEIVFFGEMIPSEALSQAHRMADACRTLLVVGTSAEVAPAGHLPLLAERRGAVIIEVNVEPTLLTGSVTDLFLQGKAGEVLPLLAEEVERQLSRD